MSGFLGSSGSGNISAATGFTGADGYISFFTGSSSIAGDNDLFWDRTGNNLVLGGASQLKWNSSTCISQTGNGNLLLTDTAGTDFDRLQLGGTTDSYPSLERVGRDIHFKLASGTDYTSIACNSLDAYGDISVNAGKLYIDPNGSNDTYLTGTTAGNNRIYVHCAGTQAWYFSAAGHLSFETLNMGANKIYGSSTILSLGADVTTSHGLGTGDVGCGQALEVDGYFYADGAQAISRTSSATDYYLTGAEYLVSITNTGAPRTVHLPPAADTTGQVFVIKDESGGAGTNNITVQPGDSGETLDGAASVAISTNYDKLYVYSDGTNYFTL